MKPWIDPINISVVKKGDDATLICRSSGKPRPTISWKRDGKIIGKRILYIYMTS